MLLPLLIPLVPLPRGGGAAAPPPPSHPRGIILATNTGSQIAEEGDRYTACHCRFNLLPVDILELVSQHSLNHLLRSGVQQAEIIFLLYIHSIIAYSPCVKQQYKFQED